MDFAEWLEQRLKDHRWKPADLAAAGKIDSGLLSRILNRTRTAGPDTALAIARALGERPEIVFRAAGILPPAPPPVADEDELLTIVRELPARTREIILTMLRALVAPSHYVEVTNSEPQTEPERELLAEFRELPAEWQEAAIDEVKHLADLRIKIIGEDENESQANQESEAA